jgi:hypothetical protein
MLQRDAIIALGVLTLGAANEKGMEEVLAKVLAENEGRDPEHRFNLGVLKNSAKILIINPHQRNS